MSYMQTHARRLLDAGYDIVPLKPGEKHPTIKHWTELNPRDEIDNWLDGPMRNWGVGIRTRNNPAIDIDCEDPGVVRDLYKAITGIIGACRTYRIGRAPRILLVCRTDEPFPKLRSAKYEDLLLSTRHQIEILGDGQQFAAYHIHPSTGKDYAWPVDGPATTLAADLPVVSLEQAREIIEAFEQIASEQVLSGRWTKVSPSTALRTTTGTESWLINHSTAKVAEISEIRDALEVLSSEDYDRWLQVGMALHHQFNGGDDGYELWDAWSQTNGGAYAGADDTRMRWDGFTSETRGNTVTIGSLFHWAGEARQSAAADTLTAMETLIRDCESFTELLGGRVADTLRDFLDSYPLLRDRIIDLVKRRGRELSGSPVSINTVRTALKSRRRTEQTNDTDTDVFPWCEPYVYLEDEDRFFHLERRVSVTRTAFDATHNRLFAAGEVAESSAARVALEIARIRVLDGARYLPGAEPIFNLNGATYANQYNPDDGAVMPEELSTADRRARELFAKHVQTLIPRPADQRVFIDYLTYVVQNPGKKVNFAILLQGQEGDGKSFFATMMAQILGPSNCKSVPGTALEKEFTGWAENSQLTFIEEIKLHGVSGHDVLNRFKPYVTNETVSIRRMHRDHYNVPNVTSYVLLTNFRNAVPLGEDDSRYYVIFSRWESASEFQAWSAENPEYFQDLYDAIAAAPGSLRKWFMERDISPSFNANGRAPMSESKREMARMSRDECLIHVDDILESIGRGEYGKNTELMSTTWLLWNWGFDGSQIPRPSTSRLTTLLLRDGWSRVTFRTKSGTETDRISVNDRNHRFWRRPSCAARVPGGGELDSVEASSRLYGTYGEIPI